MTTNASISTGCVMECWTAKVVKMSMKTAVGVCTNSKQCLHASVNYEGI